MKRKYTIITTIIALLLSAVMLCSCTNGGGNMTLVASFAKTLPQGSTTPEVRQKINEDNPVSEEFLNSVNGFAYRTASELLKNELENSNYSPVSVYFALAMLSYGAEGKTEKELFKLLGLDGKDNAYLAQSVGNLYRRLFYESDDCKLKIANSLWLQQDVSFKQDYVDGVKNSFYADGYNVDFADQTIAGQMSQWISDNTYGTLKPELEVNEDQILAIINTIYFIDSWRHEFSKQMTKEMTFNTASGKVECDFMRQTIDGYYYYKGTNFTRVELSYVNGCKMSFVLPDQGTSANQLFATPETLKQALTGGVRKGAVLTVEVPKYTFKADYDLIPLLEKLGAGTMFTDRANFSDITDLESCVATIQHGTYVKVDEKGTEASGYTYIGVTVTSTAIELSNVTVTFDRPFIAAITSPEGAVMFVGITQNPAAE